MPDDPLGAFMVGPSLVAPGRPEGPGHGTRFVAKDIIDVAGLRTGAGNPDWLADAGSAPGHAPAVQALLTAGADLWGKTVTDELAFSLSGTNCHYGTPRNSAAPGHVPGGSSSGSASAVAGGAAPLALGTDTGGSIRVPASYCGVYGLRPTHGRIDTAGVVPLAPSFDTVGLLAVDGRTLGFGWRALVTGAERRAARTPARSIRRLVMATDLLEAVDDEVAGAVEEAAAALAARRGLAITTGRLGTAGSLQRWREAFQTIQYVEAWRSHGAWITRRRPTLGPGITMRFEEASQLDPGRARPAHALRRQVATALAVLVGDDGLLVQPAAGGPAPALHGGDEERLAVRVATLTLTVPASMVGAPVLALPIARAAGQPMGVAVVGLPGDDEVLVELAAGGQPADRHRVVGPAPGPGRTAPPSAPIGA